MTIYELVIKLQDMVMLDKLNPDTKVKLANDEEWNEVYDTIEMQLDEENNLVLFGYNSIRKESNE